MNLSIVYVHSRGEVEGADSDCQGSPWKTREGVQPHQPGAQPSGQETEKGTNTQELPTNISLNLQVLYYGNALCGLTVNEFSEFSICVF